MRWNGSEQPAGPVLFVHPGITRPTIRQQRIHCAYKSTPGSSKADTVLDATDRGSPGRLWTCMRRAAKRRFQHAFHIMQRMQ